jgi:hypothetical protein
VSSGAGRWALGGGPSFRATHTQSRGGGPPDTRQAARGDALSGEIQSRLRLLRCIVPGAAPRSSLGRVTSPRGSTARTLAPTLAWPCAAPPDAIHTRSLDSARDDRLLGRPGPCCQRTPFQGLTALTPQSSKSATLRVASLAPRTWVMAAICASAWLMGLPRARR